MNSLRCINCGLVNAQGDLTMPGVAAALTSQQGGAGAFRKTTRLEHEAARLSRPPSTVFHWARTRRPDHLSARRSRGTAAFGEMVRLWSCKRPQVAGSLHQVWYRRERFASHPQT